jgi:hypothetical protein
MCQPVTLFIIVADVSFFASDRLISAASQHAGVERSF